MVAWRDRAENICKYFKKGERIGVVGRIETRKYEDKTGNNRTAVEIICDSFDFIERKVDDEFKPPKPAEKKGPNIDVDNDDLPF